MPVSFEKQLVVAVASSALFDLTESDAVFVEQKEDAYRAYQEAHLNDTLDPGVAFAFVKRLLALNDLSVDGQPLVEVVIMSRNDPETGLRVMNSIEDHQLPITRAVFRAGRSPVEFLDAFDVDLYLTADAEAVQAALEAGHAAGLVLPQAKQIDPGRKHLRIAFDFDGVLADDVPERVMQERDLSGFHAHEQEHLHETHGRGPLWKFAKALKPIQEAEDHLAREADARGERYERRMFVSMVTARNAPSHARTMKSLKDWGIRIDDGFFLGGVDKGRVMRVLRPHVFFDDQKKHLESTSQYAPAVHVPYGVTNEESGHVASNVSLDTDATLGAGEE